MSNHAEIKQGAFGPYLMGAPAGWIKLGQRRMSTTGLPPQRSDPACLFLPGIPELFAFLFAGELIHTINKRADVHVPHSAFSF